ncbi:MAG TPA: type IV pilus assembly protein PilM [Fimbriimonadaceae bacterium]|nr:type IV pilus assembly protein PilM [Fimbriimonadaceae bacterium]
MSFISRDRSKHALGVDIGNRDLKLVLLSRVGDSMSVDAVKIVPLERGVVLDGVIQDRKDLARTLRQALADIDLGAISTVISVPTQFATLRWVSLPQLPPAEHRIAASYKVKKHLPYPIDDAFLSTTPVHETNEDGIGESLVISVPRQVIASRASAVERAGLNPVAAELEAQAILRILERSLTHRSPLLRDASMTIIDVGGAKTEMYVVQNQKLQFIRSVRFGSTRICNRIADELSVSESLGHAMLANPEGHVDADGILTLPYEGQSIKISIKAELDVLLKEIARLMRYFRSLHAERSYAGILDHMMLCGGFANLAGLGDYLAEQLKVRIEPLEPFGTMTFNVSNEAFELASQSQNSFAIAVGLALSQFDSEEIEETEDVNNDFIWARGA